MAPRPATDPKRWQHITGGRNINRKPKQSTTQKALGMLPFGKKATPAKGSSRKSTAGKAAMLTAAAGVVYKNREKIMGMVGKRRGSQPPKPA